MLLMCRAAAGIDDGQVDAAAAGSHEECLRLLRLRGEELRLVRKQVEALEHEVQQAAAAAAAAAAAPALVEAITQIELPVTRQLPAPSSSSSSVAVTKVPVMPAKARSVFERLADESNFTGATREKILMKRVRIKFIGRWMSRWRQALPALRAERMMSLAASKVRQLQWHWKRLCVADVLGRQASRRRPSPPPKLWPARCRSCGCKCNRRRRAPGGQTLTQQLHQWQQKCFRLNSSISRQLQLQTLLLLLL